MRLHAAAGDCPRLLKMDVGSAIKWRSRPFRSPAGARLRTLGKLFTPISLDADALRYFAESLVDRPAIFTVTHDGNLSFGESNISTRHEATRARSFSRHRLPQTELLPDCVTVRSMVNIARLTIWSICCSRGGGEGRADPLIVAPFIGAA